MSRKSNFRLYRVWDGIIQRCCNPNAKNYYNYGGRGISVCDEWRTDFSAFEEYCISNGWKEGLQIDRVNNNGNYCPGNIRFVTQAENLRNKRTNHMITLLEDMGIVEDDREWVCSKCKAEFTVCVCGKDRTGHIKHCPYCGAMIIGERKGGDE